MDIDEKAICTSCVGESYLRAEIEREEEYIDCSYCDETAVLGCNLLTFAQRIDLAFEQHYERQAEDIPDDWPIERIKYMGSEWEPSGQLVIYAIMDAANISEAAAADVQVILEDKHYSHSSAEIGETSAYHEGSYYDTKSPDNSEWDEKWSKFEDSLKNKTRFFSKEASKYLHSIFFNIEHLKSIDHKSVVYYVGPKSELEYIYRARVFQSDEKLKFALEFPDKELGPPPPPFAKAGRMNANGISIFYGANNISTVLSEIRPPVGSKVAVAKFKILRPLKILNLTSLIYTVAKGSIFDKEYAHLLSRMSFLRKLSKHMTRPIMPDDENFEYLPTQAVADFLASEMNFDGIIFPSAQSQNGVNIALFNHASRVENLDRSTIFNASLNEYDEGEYIPYYYITRNALEVESKKNEKEKELQEFISTHKYESEAPDPRIDTLSIDLNTITIEHINSVEIITETFETTYS